MSEATKNWNNQIRATNAALALAAYVKIKGEPEGPDEDDIENLIIDLLHLKSLVSEKNPCEFIQYVADCAGAAVLENADQDWGQIVYEGWPEGGREELRKWEQAIGSFNRPVIEEPPPESPQPEATRVEGGLTIKAMSRDELVKHLEARGFQCYGYETIDELREAALHDLEDE